LNDWKGRPESFLLSNWIVEARDVASMLCVLLSRFLAVLWKKFWAANFIVEDRLSPYCSSRPLSLAKRTEW